ncbi:hypothetical protein LCGC14_0771960 [marine sediment metagenome]|uniref:Uncharacterized protein n=1 Tax=marine sediment metagenome TaxID=412755 RepID=A0A0F9Q273_9ZZZZ
MRLSIAESKEHVTDLHIVETEIRHIQGENFYGEITFHFKHGVLQPIFNKKETKTIKQI